MLELGRLEDAITALNSLLVDFFTNPVAQGEVATALQLKGFALASLGRAEDACLAYDQLITHFRGTTDPVISAQVGSALLSKAESLSVCDRWDEALVAYDTLLIDFASPNDALIVGTVTPGTVTKAARLVAVVRSRDALTAFDMLFRTLDGLSGHALTEQLERALFDMGVALELLDQFQDAIVTYDELITRFSVSDASLVRKHVAQAYFYKSLAHKHADNLDNAIRACNMLEAQKLRDHARALAERNDFTQAISVYDDVISRFSDSNESETRRILAAAYIDKAVILADCQHSNEALAVYDTVIRSFSRDNDSHICEELAMAFTGKALVLQDLDRLQEMMATYKQMIKHFSGAREPAIRYEVDRALAAIIDALVDEAYRLCGLNQFEKVLVVCEKLSRRFKTLAKSQFTFDVCDNFIATLWCKGTALTQLDRLEEALAAYELLDDFSKTTPSTLSVDLVEALIDKARLLCDLGKHHEEIALYDSIVDRFSTSEDPGIVASLATALGLRRARLGAHTTFMRADTWRNGS